MLLKEWQEDGWRWKRTVKEEAEEEEVREDDVVVRSGDRDKFIETKKRVPGNLSARENGRHRRGELRRSVREVKRKGNIEKKEKKRRKNCREGMR